MGGGGHLSLGRSLSGGLLLGLYSGYVLGQGALGDAVRVLHRSRPPGRLLLTISKHAHNAHRTVVSREHPPLHHHHPWVRLHTLVSHTLDATSVLRRGGLPRMAPVVGIHTSTITHTTQLSVHPRADRSVVSEPKQFDHTRAPGIAWNHQTDSCSGCNTQPPQTLVNMHFHTTTCQ